MEGAETGEDLEGHTVVHWVNDDLALVLIDGDPGNKGIVARRAIPGSTQVLSDTPFLAGLESARGGSARAYIDIAVSLSSPSLAAHLAWLTDNLQHYALSDTEKTVIFGGAYDEAMAAVRRVYPGSSEDIERMIIVLHRYSLYSWTATGARRKGVGLYYTAMFLNHGCRPSLLALDNTTNGEDGMPDMTQRFVTARDVARGEELTWNYLGLATTAQLGKLDPSVKRKFLLEYFGAPCGCTECGPE